jgi:hypothetical protein
LIGVHKVRFTDDDRLAWFDDVLDVDEISLTNQLHSAPTINPDFMVSGDAMNHSFIWLLHKFHTSDKLSNSVIHDTKVALISIMHYKFITSLIAWYFKYPADREIALAAYSSLSKKFDIKQYGSWSALIRARAESIIAKSGIHFNTYVRYIDDRSIIYMVNDIQSRIRELIKALTREFMEIHEKNARLVNSRLIDHTIHLQIIHPTFYLIYFTGKRQFPSTVIQLKTGTGVSDNLSASILYLIYYFIYRRRNFLLPEHDFMNSLRGRQFQFFRMTCIKRSRTGQRICYEYYFFHNDYFLISSTDESENSLNEKKNKIYRIKQFTAETFSISPCGE